MQKSTLDKLLDTTPQLWKGRRPNHRQDTLGTGYKRLDARLPGGGWPLGAATELISSQPGLGELSLLLPVLAALGQKGQWVTLVDPPWIPYPASLHAHGLSLEHLLLVRTRNEKESLWACEQILRSGRGGAVLAWPERIAFTRLRRLQLAAKEQLKLAFLYRPTSALAQPSPASLRLHLEDDGHKGTRINVIKCRGAHPPPPVNIPFSTYAKTDYRSRRRPAGPGWVSRATRAVPEGPCASGMQSSAAAFRRRREQGSETP